MLEILYFIFIFPLEQILGFLLTSLHSGTGSYGVSIVLLSFMINLFMLKATLYFERRGREVQAIKAICDNKIAEFKRVFKGAELQSYIRTLYKQKHFHPLYTLFGLGGLAVQIPFFIAIFQLVSHTDELHGVGFLWIDDLATPDVFTLFFSFHLLPIIMTILTLINVFYSSKDRATRIQGFFIACIFLVLLYSMPSALVLYWSCNMLFSLLKEVWRNYAKSFMPIFLKVWPRGTKRDNNQPTSFLEKVFNICFPSYNSINSKTYRDISILALLNICVMVCIFTPYAMYSSDVSQFDVKQTYQTLGALFGWALCSSLILIYSTSFFYKSRLLKIGSFGVSVILLIGIIYTFALDYNVITGEHYSQLDNFAFKNPDILAHPYNKFVDLFVGVFSCCIIFICMRYFLRILRQMFLVLLIGFVGVSAFSLTSIYKQHKEITAKQVDGVKQADTLEKYLPPFQHDLGAFSKDAENVLVLLFDAFTGSHLQIIFEQFPELKKEFSGFVYYPNTISLDGNTAVTAHTILSGFKTSPFQHRNDNLETYWENVASGLKQTYKALRDAGFSVQSYNMPHIKPDKELGDGINIYARNYAVRYMGLGDKDYFSYYENLYGLTSLLQKLRTQGRPPVGEFASLGLFYFAPYSLRIRLYTMQKTVIAGGYEFADYTWIFATGRIKTFDFFSGVNTTSQLPSIVRNLNTDAKGKTFKYIHTLHTHYPWVLDSKTCIPSLEAKTQLPDKYKPFLPNPHHYDNEICAIKETIILLDFLKKNHIYDNTMIVLVSDHSMNDLPAHNMSNRYSLGNAPNPLLMIKNFKDNGQLQEDHRLMSNADVYGILCDSLLKGKCEVENILKNYPRSRAIIHTRNIHWTSETERAKHLVFDKVWIVKDNVLDPKAFKDVTQEFKNGTLNLDGVEY